MVPLDMVIDYCSAPRTGIDLKKDIKQIFMEGAKICLIKEDNKQNSIERAKICLKKQDNKQISTGEAMICSLKRIQQIIPKQRLFAKH
ncbi:hypothetical protein [Gracilibacillus sp. HCP3S3_G5_2]|uniref:hypothetical protein n=1 Tax=Gracilibacillus sp. HCP3S3_G5_2 TaxID=3438941 RepID=UPI003F8B6EFE